MPAGPEYNIVSSDLLRDHFLHGLKALLEVQLRSVQQHGVVCLLEGSCGAVGVLIVALLDVGQHIFVGVSMPFCWYSFQRRVARASGLAVRKIFTVALGSTTVPMSRPSIRMFCVLAMSRCISSRKARTAGFAPRQKPPSPPLRCGWPC